MNFIVSSSVLSGKLAEMSKVMNPKVVDPVLGYFLFRIKGEKLQITASDGDCTQCSTVDVVSTSEDGELCMPSTLLLNAMKNIPEQPLTFIVNPDNYSVVVKYNNGKFDFQGRSSEDYIVNTEIKGDFNESVIRSNILSMAISQTSFAVATDDLRPIMCGIYFTVTDGKFQVAASDGHKLARNTYPMDANTENAGDMSLIIPMKPAKLIKGLSTGEQQVRMLYNEREATFIFENDALHFRLLEGRFPNYNAVIPKNNDKVAVIDRSALLAAIKRVGVFSSLASGCIVMRFSGLQVTVSGEDIDFSTSAEEIIFCTYNGNDITIGFKREYLRQILETFTSEEVRISMSDKSRAALFTPVTDEKEIDNLSLLMPMMVDD